jgi:DNA invertase Pin-like site-specific DNA recombinase
MKAALYLRVSTLDDKQTTENQRRELTAVAQRLGYTIVAEYEDAGISGFKGRDKRPAFDRLHRDTTRRQFDIVMAWSVDRLGRSLKDLLHLLEHLHSRQVGLYLHQQQLDTTTPGGKAMFQMMGVFAEFERAMMRERILAGLARVRAKGSKSGKPIGHPTIPPATQRAIREAYMRGDGSMRKLAKQFNVALMTVQKCVWQKYPNNQGPLSKAESIIHSN